MERIATIALLAASAAGLYLLKTDQLSRIQASETEAAIAADAEMAAEAGKYTFVLSVSDTYGSTTTAESTVVIDDELNGAPTAKISVSLAQVKDQSPNPMFTPNRRPTPSFSRPASEKSKNFELKSWSPILASS
jgi:5-hydroxyisourate hydrolase-like protein (transthyretin family)